MKHSILFTISVLLLNSPLTASESKPKWEDSQYLKPPFLKQTAQVNQALKKDGCEEVSFNTQDNQTLKALFFKHDKAQATLICFSGFDPGHKEELAPFFAMFQEEYNILLVEGRGRGGSTGLLSRLYLNLWWYGFNEKYDALAALEYAHKATAKPSFMLGLCAGAFNVGHAAAALGKTASEKGLKGIIFDSGWASLPIAGYTNTAATAQDGTAKGVRCLYTMPDKQCAKNTYAYKIISAISTGSIWLAHRILFNPIHSYYDRQTNLNNHIQNCKVPALYVHWKGDEDAQVQHVQELAKKTSENEFWCIEKPSKHANNHLKHPNDYKDKIKTFINSKL